MSMYGDITKKNRRLEILKNQYGNTKAMREGYDKLHPTLDECDIAINYSDDNPAITLIFKSWNNRR